MIEIELKESSEINDIMDILAISDEIINEPCRHSIPRQPNLDVVDYDIFYVTPINSEYVFYDYDIKKDISKEKLLLKQDLLAIQKKMKELSDMIDTVCLKIDRGE